MQVKVKKAGGRGQGNKDHLTKSEKFVKLTENRKREKKKKRTTFYWVIFAFILTIASIFIITQIVDKEQKLVFTSTENSMPLLTKEDREKLMGNSNSNRLRILKEENADENINCPIPLPLSS